MAFGKKKHRGKGMAWHKRKQAAKSGQGKEQEGPTLVFLGMCVLTVGLALLIIAFLTSN